MFRVSPVSSQQAEAIFRVASMQTKLRKLYVSFTDLSTIEPSMLAKAVSGMEEVQLGLSQVSSQQAEAIIRALDGKTKLRKLCIPVIDLSSVESELLARAIAGLEEVKIGCSPISLQQAEVIFREVNISVFRNT